MTGVAAALIEETAGLLRAEGLTVATDPRNVSPPCVLVMARTLTPRSRGIVRAELVVQCIAPGVGHGDALQWLDQTLAAAWAALPTRPAATLTAIESPQTGMAMLAYELVYEVDYTHEEGN